MPVSKDSCPWVYKETGAVINSIEDMPEDVFGFIYYVKFKDGTFYVGKKELFATRALPRQKSGKPRTNHVKYEGNNERILYETNWKTYVGSSDQVIGRAVKYKHILEYAFNSLELTYLETKYLFTTEALERHNGLNRNILGRFFKDKVMEARKTNLVIRRK